MLNTLIVSSNLGIMDVVKRLSYTFLGITTITVKSLALIDKYELEETMKSDIIIFDSGDFEYEWDCFCNLFKPNGCKLIAINSSKSSVFLDIIKTKVDSFLTEFNEEQLEFLIFKYSKQLKQEQTSRSINVTALIQPFKQEVFIMNKYSGEKVAWNDIIMFKGNSNYSLLYTTHKTHTLCKTLKEIESDISNSYPNLIRIHKSYIINKTFLVNVYSSGNKKIITLKNGMELEISRRRWVVIKGVLVKC